MHEAHEDYMKRRMQETTLGDVLDAALQEAREVNDPVDPQHYNSHVIEPITYIMANQLDFAEGNVVKYVSRWRKKGGVGDLRKARQYLDFIIRNEEEGTPL